MLMKLKSLKTLKRFISSFWDTYLLVSVVWFSIYLLVIVIETFSIVGNK